MGGRSSTSYDGLQPISSHLPLSGGGGEMGAAFAPRPKESVDIPPSRLDLDGARSIFRAPPGLRPMALCLTSALG